MTVPSAAPAADVYDTVMRAAAALAQLPPRPASIAVNQVTLYALLFLARLASPAFAGTATTTSLASIPIVIDHDLDIGQWEARDRDGNVMDRGVL